MPERFKVVCTMQGAIQVLSFTFTFTFYNMQVSILQRSDRPTAKYTPTNDGPRPPDKCSLAWYTLHLLTAFYQDSSIIFRHPVYTRSDWTTNVINNMADANVIVFSVCYSWDDADPLLQAFEHGIYVFNQTLTMMTSWSSSAAAATVWMCDEWRKPASVHWLRHSPIISQKQPVGRDIQSQGIDGQTAPHLHGHKHTQRSLSTRQRTCAVCHRSPRNHFESMTGITDNSWRLAACCRQPARTRDTMVDYNVTYGETTPCSEKGYSFRDNISIKLGHVIHAMFSCFSLHGPFVNWTSSSGRHGVICR